MASNISDDTLAEYTTPEAYLVEPRTTTLSSLSGNCDARDAVSLRLMRTARDVENNKTRVNLKGGSVRDGVSRAICRSVGD